MGLIYVDLLCRLLLPAHAASHRMEPELILDPCLQLPGLHGKEPQHPKMRRQPSLMEEKLR